MTEVRQSDDEDRNALPAGTAIDEYVLDATLGSGGFGITYRARDQFGRFVAIKEYLPSDLAVRETDLTVHPRSGRERETYGWGLDRFWEEAQTLALFKHPNIVQVNRYFAANNTAYMVMEYEKGEKFSDLLARRQFLPEHELWTFLDPLLGGLEQVHRAGILHRDIKPDNIYVRTNGTPLLLDFGAARQALSSRSRNLTAVLTPPFAPIEQYGSHFPQGPWTDIYAMGVVIYEALTGATLPSSPDRNNGAPFKPLAEAARGRCTPGMLAGVDAALQIKGQDRPKNVPEWRKIFASERPAASQRRATTKDRRPTERRWVVPVVVTGVLLLILAGPAILTPMLLADGRATARARAATDQIATLKQALDAFNLDLGRYPTSSEGLDALVKAPANADDASRWSGPYLAQNASADPWGDPFYYLDDKCRSGECPIAVLSLNEFNARHTAKALAHVQPSIPIGADQSGTPYPLPQLNYEIVFAGRPMLGVNVKLILRIRRGTDEAQIKAMMPSLRQSIEAYWREGFFDYLRGTADLTAMRRTLLEHLKTDGELSPIGPEIADVMFDEIRMEWKGPV